MLPYDKTTLDAFANSSSLTVNSSAIRAADVYSAINAPSELTTYITSDYLELSGKRFSTKQLAYLLSKLLDEHPECQV